ncbi:MAG: ATP-binding cassette domain-containing protein [Rhodospirillales bacterium]|nr:ATP-binding cassette domain-containing protein [Rhodospirillales bacterium]
MPDGTFARLLRANLPAVGRAILPLSGRGLKIMHDGRALLDVEEIHLSGQGLTAIMGPNGAGKSLLLRVLAGLVTPGRGAVLWGEVPPRRDLRNRLGFVFQNPVLLRRSALANVAYALSHAGLSRKQARSEARRALVRARLGHLADRPARLLSGGEQQRLALARALALTPEVLFLDEPTASLDPASTLAIEEMIGAARRAGTRLVLVSHDAGQARRLADEILFLHRGRLVEHSRAGAFFEAPASREARAYLAGEILL